MRYIIGTNDEHKENVWERIAAEMLNLECGKQFYKRGKWIERKKGQNIPSYPEIFDENDKRFSIRINANQGVIYLPNVDSILTSRGIVRKIMDFIRKEILAHPELKLALKSLHSLDTGNQGFTALKAKTITEKCYTNSHLLHDSATSGTPTEFYQRIFTWCSSPVNSYTAFSSVIPYGRFIWCITPLQELYSFLGRPSVTSEANMSLVTSIVYDNKNILNLHDDALVFKSLRLDMFNHFGTFKNLLAYGDFKDMRLRNITEVSDSQKHSEENSDTENSETPEVSDDQKHSETSETGTGTSTAPTTPSATSTASDVITSAKNAWKFYRQEERVEKNYPGYIPGLRVTKNCIIYCTVFGTAWEILRWFSPLWYKLFTTDACTGVNLVREFRESDLKKLYEIDFSDAEIDNTGDNSKCEFCSSPLYDDIYCLFPSKENKKCRAFCALCIHACFQKSPVFVSGFAIEITADSIKDYVMMGTEYSTPLYIQDIYGAEAIGRTKYPRTFEEVVDNEINYTNLNLSEYKRIIKMIHNKEPAIIKDASKYVHNYAGIGKHDYEHIAGVIGKYNNTIYLFPISSGGKLHRLMQRSYYEKHLGENENENNKNDAVVFIPVEYFQAKEVKLSPFGIYTTPWQ